MESTCLTAICWFGLLQTDLRLLAFRRCHWFGNLPGEIEVTSIYPYHISTCAKQFLMTLSGVMRILRCTCIMKSSLFSWGVLNLMDELRCYFVRKSDGVATPLPYCDDVTTRPVCESGERALLGCVWGYKPTGAPTQQPSHEPAALCDQRPAMTFSSSQCEACRNLQHLEIFQIAGTLRVFGVEQSSWYLGICTARDLSISGKFFVIFST